MRSPTGACIVHVQKALLSNEVIVIDPGVPFSSIFNSEQLDAVIVKKYCFYKKRALNVKMKSAYAKQK